MEDELLKVFDEQFNPIGKAPRTKIHVEGLWHETVHFWLMTKMSGKHYVFLQKRSKSKRDYPALLDITAAGHLLATEASTDGVRELQEELGLPSIERDKLYKLGTVKNIIHTNKLVDNEFSHVYLYIVNEDISFHLQEEEVSDIVVTEFMAFYPFCMAERDELVIYPWRDGKVISEEESKAGKNNFVPHEEAYFKKVAELLKQQLESLE